MKDSECIPDESVPNEKCALVFSSILGSKVSEKSAVTIRIKITDVLTLLTTRGGKYCLHFDASR